MKKIFLAITVFAFVACNNDSDSSSGEDTTVTNVSGVENVNGNIPDTTNTISIDGTSQPTDKAVDTSDKQ